MEKVFHKVAVVGSRNFPELPLVDTILEVIGPCIIVSGGAIGVDRRARDYAFVNEWPEPITFLPDWKQYGRSAGFIRNSLIINEAEICLAFWDGESKGTVDSIKKANERKIPIVLFQMVSPDTFRIRIKNNDKRHELLSEFEGEGSGRYSIGSHEPAKGWPGKRYIS